MFHRTIIALVASALAAPGCGARTARDGRPDAIERATPLEARMDAIGTRVLELGYQPSGWSRAGEIGPGGRRTAALRTSGPGRLLLVAIGDPGAAADLNLTITGPDGEIEAEDRAADRRAAVEFAPIAGETYRVEIANEAADEASPFLLRAFAAGPAVEPAALFGLFDADSALAPDWSVVEARASAMRMTGGVVSRTVASGRGERISERLRLDEGKCYLFVAQGSAGIDSVSLRVTDEGGLLVADLSARQTAAAQLCAETDVDARLGIEVTAGSGRLRIEGFSAERSRMARSYVGPPLRPVEQPVTIEAAMRWADQQLARSGYDPAEVQFEGWLSAGGRQQSSVRLSAGECAVISAISGSGVRDLDVEVSNPAGKLVAADSTPGPSSLVRLCSPTATEYRVSLVGRGGEGLAVLMVSRLPSVELQNVRADPPRGVREAAALFRRHAFEPLSEIAPATRVPDSRPPAWTAPVELERGRCYGIAAAADGASVERLELRRPSGEPAAVWKLDLLPATLTWCPEDGGTFEVLVVADREPFEPPPLIVLFGSDAVAYSAIGTP